MFTPHHPRTFTLQRMLALSVLCIILFLSTACGPRMQSTTGQTPAQVEQSNPGLHLHSTSTTGNVEQRTYRNWSWTSVGSYFKPNRNYVLSFTDGALTSWSEQ